jgi:hypothetical protein
LGAVGFLFGSLFLFPYFRLVVDNELIAGWLFVVGSFTFAIADGTELVEYLRKRKLALTMRYLCFSGFTTNIFLLVFGRFILFIGSYLLMLKPKYHK